MLPRARLIETATEVYRSYGFCPIDTPALEYLDILLGKGSAETDKQLLSIYRSRRSPSRTPLRPHRAARTIYHTKTS